MASLLLVGSDDQATRLFARALRERFGEIPIVIERKESPWTIVRRRAGKLGWPTALGQLLFILYGRLTAGRHAARIREIMVSSGHRDGPFQEWEIRRVDSVNSEAFLDIVRKESPKVVVVNGTRIISRTILASSRCVFINTHFGITPKYRGVHGGYWSLVENDADKFGVTIHLVDPGVDTGEIIEQILVAPSPEDNFFTYPMLQATAAVPGLLRAVENALAGRIARQRPQGLSKQWYHPTLLAYFLAGLRKGTW